MTIRHYLAVFAAMILTFAAGIPVFGSDAPDKVKVSGKVIDEAGVPVIGIAVISSDGSSGTITIDGKPFATKDYQIGYLPEERGLYPKKKVGEQLVYLAQLRGMSAKDAKAQMIWGLQQADVVKISDEEVEFLFGLGVREGAAHILDNYGVKLVFVTCGPDGCFFASRKAEGHVPGLTNIKVADTTGAGDIFGGSAVYKLLCTGKAPEELTEEEIREAVTFACTAAGLSTTKPGGISSVPTREEVENYR